MHALSPEIAALMAAARAKGAEEGRAVEVAPGDVWTFSTKERAVAFAARRRGRFPERQCSTTKERTE